MILTVNGLSNPSINDSKYFSLSLWDWDKDKHWVNLYSFSSEEISV